MSTYLADLFSHQAGYMDIEVWLEPFAGGAGAGLTLLEAGAVSDVWLIEANPAIAAFWRHATTDGEALAARVAATTPTMALWSWAREVVAAGAGVQPGDLGYAAFVVNRCSRSGMVTPKVGPMGGKTQAGQWTLGARFNGPELADRIRRVARFGDSLRIIEGDAIECIADLAESGIDQELFAFVDPPYLREGPRLYAHGFTMDQHRQLAAALRTCPARWMLTYDDEPVVLDLYADHRVVEYDIAHTANRQRVDREYAVFSDNLFVPPGQQQLLPRGASMWMQGPDIDTLPGLAPTNPCCTQ